jgi:hypothetical protein
VDKAVSGAGHVWNATRRDFGIDGHIEFCYMPLLGFFGWEVHDVAGVRCRAACS